MGWKFLETVDYEGEPYHIVCKGAEGTVGFNPLTDQSDLMDVECALGIDVLHDEEYITAEYWQHGLLEFDDKKRIANYAHNKFTARSAAVCAVAEQIYDKGKV